MEKDIFRVTKEIFRVMNKKFSCFYNFFFHLAFCFFYLVPQKMQGEKLLKSVTLKFIVVVFLHTSAYFIEICKPKFIVVFCTHLWLLRKLRENYKIQILNATIFSTTKHIKQRTTKTKDRIKQIFDISFPRKTFSSSTQGCQQTETLAKNEKP